MLLHPAISEVSSRRDSLSEAIFKGRLTADVGRYLSPGWAYVYKDRETPSLAFANTGNADEQMSLVDQGALAYVVTTDDEDRDGDIVKPMGGHLENYSRNPIVFFGHQEWEIPIGVCRSPDGRVTVFPEENRMVDLIWFDRKDPDADFIFQKCQRKILNATSIAFVPIEAWRRDDVRKARTHGDSQQTPPGWYFNQWDKTEVSIVGVPSNPKAIGLEKDLQGACRDVFDRERGFMSIKLQKAWQPYAATAKGSWTGWSPLPTEEKDLATSGVDKAEKPPKSPELQAATEHSQELWEKLSGQNLLDPQGRLHKDTLRRLSKDKQRVAEQLFAEYQQAEANRQRLQERWQRDNKPALDAYYGRKTGEKAIVFDDARARRELEKMMLRATKQIFGVTVRRLALDSYEVEGSAPVNLTEATKILVEAYNRKQKSADEKDIGGGVVLKAVNKAKLPDDPRELNALMNQYAREPEAQQIGSPYRVQEYCKLRIRGKSPQEALEAVRSKPKQKSAEPDPEMQFAAEVRKAGEELAANTDPAPMPGYGQIFRGPDNQLWYVGGDGDEDGFADLVVEKLQELTSSEVTYEAESFPPKDEGWEQLYPEQKMWSKRRKTGMKNKSTCSCSDCTKGKACSCAKGEGRFTVSVDGLRRGGTYSTLAEAQNSMWDFKEGGDHKVEYYYDGKVVASGSISGPKSLKDRKAMVQADLDSPGVPGRNANPDGKACQEKSEGVEYAEVNVSKSKMKKDALGQSEGRIGGYTVPPGGVQSEEEQKPLDDIQTESWATCETCHGDSNCEACGGVGEGCEECGGSGECGACAGEGHVKKSVRKKGGVQDSRLIRLVADLNQGWVHNAKLEELRGRTLVLTDSNGRIFEMELPEEIRYSNGKYVLAKQLDAPSEEPAKLSTPQVLAALYSHAKAEAAYLDQLDDTYKDSLADYRKQQVEERMDMLKYQFSRAAGEDDDIEKLCKAFEDEHDDQHSTEEKAGNPYIAGYVNCPQCGEAIAVPKDTVRNVGTLRCGQGHMFPYKKSDIRPEKALESTGPDSVMEPGEAGLVEQGEVPPEDEEQLTEKQQRAKTMKQNTVPTEGAYVENDPEAELFNSKEVGGKWEAYQDQGKWFIHNMQDGNNYENDEGPFGNYGEAAAAAKVNEKNKPSLFNKAAPGTEEWEEEKVANPADSAKFKVGDRVEVTAHTEKHGVEGTVAYIDPTGSIRLTDVTMRGKPYFQSTVYVQAGDLTKKSLRKAAPDTDEWAEEEMTEPEHKADSDIVEEKQGKVCMCGMDVPEGAAECPGCGAPVNGAKQEDEKLEKQELEEGTDLTAADEEIVPKDSDPSTEEILERYQHPKSNKWATRKWLVKRSLLPFLKYRVAANGRKYLVRAKASGKYTVIIDGEPFLSTYDINEALRTAKKHGGYVVDSDGDKVKALEGEQEEPTLDDSEIKSLTTKLAGAIDDLKALFKAPGIPKHLKPGLKHVADQIWYVGKALTDKGKEQKNGGSGSELTDKGKEQRDGGKGSELSDKGEQQGKTPTKSNGRSRQVSPVVQRKFEETLAKLRRHGLLNGA